MDIKNLAGSAKSFFVPNRQRLNGGQDFFDKQSVVAIIPSYKPKAPTLQLIKNLNKWHPKMRIIVVDDSTPEKGYGYKNVEKIVKLSKANRKIIYLRTPVNRHKAGALNYGLKYLKSSKAKKPQVIVTLDDDINLNKEAIPTMIKELYSDFPMGAICSMIKVRNKNKNFLTRLQALEYHNFNVTKISDNGFLKGPLVMPGALTVYRYDALIEAGGFTTGHLIEDYDVTAKLKKVGWKVGISKAAEVWTEVPESLNELWKQRVRWTLGGLGVVADFWKNTEAIFQDLIGHLLFLSLFLFIAFSFIFACDCSDNPVLVLFLIVMSIVNIIAANSFNILTFLSYTQKDKTDWLIKLSFVPEFIYSNILTLVLFGSYVFFLYSRVLGKLTNKVSLANKAYRTGLSMFSKVGYSYSWGTRQA